MVVADDDVREWGTQDWAEKSAAYSEQGYVPISMKNDFLQIYPETVTRADTQYTEIESDAPDNSNIIQFEEEKNEDTPADDADEADGAA